MKKFISLLFLGISLAFGGNLPASAETGKQKPIEKESLTQSEAQKPESKSIYQPISEDKRTPVIKFKKEQEALPPETKPVAFLLPQQNYKLPWSSVNAGGNVTMSSNNFKMKATSGQSVIGQAGSTNFKMGMGFWYGTSSPCVEAIVGDLALPLNEQRSPADVVTLINTVFKSRPLPIGVNPCAADLNKSGDVPSPADVVTLINNVFKNRPLPAGDRCGC